MLVRADRRPSDPAQLLDRGGDAPLLRAIWTLHIGRGRKPLARVVPCSERDWQAPTMLQSAYLARVNVTYAWWAFKRQAERAAIEAGLIPLVPSERAKANGTSLAVPPAPAPGIGDMDLIHIAKHVGTDRMLAAAMAAEVDH